jgi:hypothetical protein
MNVHTCLAIAISLGIAHKAFSAPVNGARITYMSKEVRLRTAPHGLEPAALGDILSAGVTIDNGAKARSELTFGNRNVVRLGANTILSLKESGALELGEGAVFFQVPKSSSTEITIGAISVASKGATGLLERNRDLYVKLLLLEGEVRVSLAGQLGESMLMEPGQILIASPKATALPETAYFDIARAISTCQLITDFPPLPGRESLANEARKQARLTSDGTYIRSNLVIFGRGTLVNVVSPGKNRPEQTSSSQPPH